MSLQRSKPRRNLRKEKYGPFPPRSDVKPTKSESVLRLWNKEPIRVWRFAIVWHDSNVVLDTRDTGPICGSLDFLCCFSHYFASYYVIFLHHCTVFGFIFWLGLQDMRVHVDVTEVSQEYICTVSKLHDVPRVLSFATKCGRIKHLT